MAHQIAPTCDACNHCNSVCPVDGAVVPGEVYRIDAELCIDCGVCVDDCPSASIYKAKIALAA